MTDMILFLLCAILIVRMAQAQMHHDECIKLFNEFATMVGDLEEDGCFACGDPLDDGQCRNYGCAQWNQEQ